MKRKLLPIFASLSIVATSCGAINPNADLNIDVEKHDDIVVRAFFPNFGTSNAKVREGWLGRAIEKYTTYNVDYNQFAAFADTEVNNFLVTKEKIDMMKITGTVFNNYVTSGYFTDLTDVIEKYGNRVVDASGRKWKDLYTKEQWEAVSYNGRIYAIPEIGHTAMANQALIWNTDHLKAVGIAHIPTTITEFDTALKKLKEHFGSDASYYPFGINGNIPNNNPICNAFGVPSQWYEDDQGKLQNMLMSSRMKTYLKYMNGLLNAGYIAGDWVSQNEANCMNNFVSQKCSVYVGSYWNVTSCRNSLVKSYRGFPENMITNSQKRAYVYGEEKRVPYKEDGLLGWNIDLKGDGAFGSPVQEKGMHRDSRGVGYYCVVPVACASRAAYIIDWISRRNTEDCTILMIAGEEGTHYSYTTKDDKDGVKLNTTSGNEKYVKTTDRFLEDISGMSQFQTSVNCDVARVWWPVAENGFDAWNVLIVDENGKEDASRLILSDLGFHPVLPQFASVDLEAQNYVITQAQYCINVATDKYEATIEKAKSDYQSRYYSKCEAELNGWYQGSKTK